MLKFISYLSMTHDCLFRTLIKIVRKKLSISSLHQLICMRTCVLKYFKIYIFRYNFKIKMTFVICTRSNSHLYIVTYSDVILVLIVSNISIIPCSEKDRSSNKNLVWHSHNSLLPWITLDEIFIINTAFKFKLHIYCL